MGLIVLIKKTETQVILSEPDLVLVRQCVKKYAIEMKFNLVNQTKLITAASEIGRNTLIYGGGGQFTLQVIESNFKNGLRLIFEDQGPGIPDLEKAFEDGYTSGKGMGLGLSGSRRLVNEFELETTVGVGTKITLTHWSSY